MPAHHAKNATKAAINKAVSQNMHELNKPGVKKRSHKQQTAIAIAESKPKHKK